MMRSSRPRTVTLALIAAAMVMTLFTTAGPAAADGHCTTYRSGGTRTEKVAPHGYESVTIRSASGSITYEDVRRGDVLTAKNNEVFIDYTVCRYSINYGCLTAAQDLTLFTIGRLDATPRAIDAALEYPADDAYFEGGVTFTVTGTSSPTPDFPAYLASMRMSEILAANPGVEQDRPLTNATPSIRIVWTQCDAAGVTFEYDRYGTETDDVTIDGRMVAAPISGENTPFSQVYDLGVLSAGRHELMITYVGGGQGNGHYIDHIRLVAQ